MTRSEACTELRNHWVDLQFQPAIRALNSIYAMDVEEVCEKIMLGDLKFAPWNLSKMDTSAEFHEEMKDAVAYHLFSILSGQEE